MSREKEAMEYAIRQWPEGAPADYIEGSKDDYLAGYGNAVVLLREYLAERIKHWYPWDEGKQYVIVDTDELIKFLEE